MAAIFSVTFKNGKKRDYTLSSDLSRDYTSVDQLANGSFTEAATYLLTQYDRNGKEVGKLLFQYAGGRGGVQLVDAETGAYSAMVYSLKDFAAGIPVFANQGKVVTTPAQEIVPAAPPPPPPPPAKTSWLLPVGIAAVAFLALRK